MKMGKRIGRIFVAEEKHTTRLFDASTDANMEKIALKLLRERLRNGWICKPDSKVDVSAEDREYFAMTDVQINGLPPALAKVARERKDRVQQKVNEHLDEVKAYERAKKAAKDGDGKTAWAILRERCCYEYEGYHFDYLEKV